MFAEGDRFIQNSDKYIVSDLLMKINGRPKRRGVAGGPQTNNCINGRAYYIISIAGRERIED